MSAPASRLFTVLIAEDIPEVRSFLVAVLRREGFQTIEAVDGVTALETIRATPIDAALLDVRMPTVDGIAATKIIRGQVPDARVILLSTFECEEHVYQGVRAGAMSYLIKNASCDELLDTIRKVHRGVTCIPPRIAAKLAARVMRSELSAREREVLRLMVAGKSNKEIGASLHITEGTIKVHVSCLMKKLAAKGRTEAINLALMHGIVDLESSS